jgi:predicted acyltransferase (DUF342 family)
MSTLFVNTISASDGSALTAVNELTASDGIAVTGSAKFASEVEVAGLTTFAGQVTASNGLKIDAGNLVVDENATITGQLTASNGLKIDAGNLVVDENATITGQLTASNGLKVDAGNLVVDENATITGKLSASNGIAVTGDATFSQDVTVSGDLDVQGALNVTTNHETELHIADKIILIASGAATGPNNYTAGTLDGGGIFLGATGSNAAAKFIYDEGTDAWHTEEALLVSGSLTANGAASLKGTVTLGDAATDVTTVTGQLTASNGLKIDAGNLVVDENATITGQLTASNGLKIDAGNLVVDENATVTGQLSASALQIANKIEADDAGLGGDLGVSGSVTAGQISGSSLQVAGKVEADDAGFGGDIGVSGTMTATTAAITTMTASNGVAVTGSAKFASEVEIAGITTVLGALTASNDILIQDDIHLAFGTGRDATIEYDEDGTDELRFAGAAVTFEQAVSFDGSVTLGADANDVITTTGELTASLGISIPDDKKLYFGTGFDASFEYDEDGTDTLLYAGASIRISDDTKLEFGTGGDASFEYDEDGNDVLLYAGANLRFGDDIKLEFGAGGDATIEYDENGTDELRFAGAAVTFEQAVTMDANVTLGDAAGDVTTVTGKLTGSNGLAITGDATFTQNVTVSGDLDVRGAVNTTTHHETELHIADKAILIASGTATGIDNYTAGTLDGAGIYLGASGSNAVAKLIYDEGNDAWATSDSFHVSGSVTAGGRVLVDDATDATSTTDGSLQTDGGLSVAKDGIVGNDLYLLSDSSVLGLGVGKDATLTHDGTTGLTIAATPISIDATGELHLNSTTGDIKFQDGGTDQLALDLDGTGGDIIMKLMVDSDDFVFQQYDGTEVFRVEDNGDFDIAGGLGSSGVTVSSAGAVSADGRIITDDTTDATNTTDGSIQTDGGLSVALDVIVGDDLSLLSDSAVLALGAGKDATFTHDGTTGLTIAATPISIDSTGGLDLNSTTGDINFQDGGTTQIMLDLDGTAGEVIMQLRVDGDDFVFKQYDGTEVFRVEDNGDFDIAGGLGSTGVTISAAGAISADGRIVTDNTTAATSTTDGSIQTDGGLSVALDAVIGDDIFLLSDASAIKFGANSDIVLTHEADRGLILTQGTETTAEPVFTIKNTGDLASGGGIEFVLDNGAGEGDDDILGFISFKGDDSGNATTQFAQMSAIASDITNADEGGKFKFEVMAGGIAGTAGLAEVLSLGGEDQANSTNCEVVVNEGGAAFVDFRVEGDSETHLLFVDAGNERVSIGDSADAPTATLEVTNHASSGATGVPVIQLNSNDVDQEALDINAANTTADVVSITVDDCLTTGNALFIDHNDGATTAVTPVTVHLDFDKDGVIGDGVSAGYKLMNLDMNDGATNHANATVEMVGIDLDIVSANAQGTINNYGVLVNVSGGDTNVAAQLIGDAASQGAVSIRNSGNNSNRYGLVVQAGTHSLGSAGSNTYVIFQSGDGSENNGIIANSGASNGNLTFAAASDERLKRDIAPTKIVGLDLLNHIQVSEFRWKKDGADGPMTNIGFVAQNCEEVYPEMVRDTGADLWTQHGEIDHDVKTVAPSELIPVLVKAVQELTAKVEELENKLSD